MALDKISQMLELCNSDTPHFPPTDLYNEGWLLRLILQWFASNRIEKHPLMFSESAKWFSEALLPTPSCQDIKKTLWVNHGHMLMALSVILASGKLEKEIYPLKKMPVSL
jgi:hypothetical protein